MVSGGSSETDVSEVSGRLVVVPDGLTECTEDVAFVVCSLV